MSYFRVVVSYAPLAAIMSAFTYRRIQVNVFALNHHSGLSNTTRQKDAHRQFIAILFCRKPIARQRALNWSSPLTSMRRHWDFCSGLHDRPLPYATYFCALLVCLLSHQVINFSEIPSSTRQTSVPRAY